jgi:ABC-2 type transport system permease protein
MQGFQLIINFLVMPVFFLSGALFPLQGLPPVMEAITKLDPLSYGIDGLRGVLIGTSNYSIATDFSILVAITLAMMVNGAYLFEKIQL